jgi:hypothetical protein
MRFSIGIMMLVITACVTTHVLEPLPLSNRVTESVNSWVAIPSDSDRDHYQYGFIYIDEEAGFTYQLTGRFKLDKSGSYIKIPDEEKNVPGKLLILVQKPNLLYLN